MKIPRPQPSAVLIVAVATMTISGALAAAEEALNVWHKAQDGPCEFASTNSQGITLHFAALEQQYWLGLTSSSDFFSVRGYQPGRIDLDARRVIELAFQDDGSALRTPLTPPLLSQLKQVKHVSVHAGGVVAAFALPDVETAMADLATCAKTASVRNTLASKVAGAENWEFVQGLPEGACTVRAHGPEIDTMLMLNDAGQLILAGGRQDWSIPPAAGKVQIRIDQNPAREFTANTLNNLLLVKVSDTTAVQRLRTGKRLVWTLPVGQLSADISGFGIAMDAIRNCRLN